jgi:2,3-dihydroxyphenylpropionate 1,2-dioxygenase
LIASVYASHTPLMRDGVVAETVKANVDRGFARLATTIRCFAPDLVVQFSPDHFNGFLYDLMPTFCVGTAAASVGDWDTKSGPLPVPEAESRMLAESLLANGIDAAISYRMNVDHGFVQIWERMFGRFDKFPLIPIFVNCAWLLYTSPSPRD